MTSKKSNEAARWVLSILMASPLVGAAPYVLPPERTMDMTIALALAGAALAASTYWLAGVILRRLCR